MPGRSVYNNSSIDETVFEQIRLYAQQTLCTEIAIIYSYHNYAHTRYVVSNALEIAKRMNYQLIDFQLIELSAWYHDLGFVLGSKKHEKRGAEILGRIMRENGIDFTMIKKAQLAIESTVIDSPPLNEYGAILKDADTGHLAFSDYRSCETLLRKELRIAEGKSFLNTDWKQKNIEFFESHNYYTKAGKFLFKDGKQSNLMTLKKRDYGIISYIIDTNRVYRY